MSKIIRYKYIGIILLLTGMISMESCRINDEPSYERIDRHTTSEDEQEDDENSSGISLEMENEDMEDEIEEINFVS